MIAFRLPSVSFGAASAIVTSMGMIVGFGAASVARPTIIAALLIVGLADNVTDSLSIHIYQESENLEQQAAFRATMGNLATRFIISLSFVVLVLIFLGGTMILVCLIWGVLLLATLTWFVAKNRNANAVTEVFKHLAVAAVVIAASLVTGTFITTYIQ